MINFKFPFDKEEPLEAGPLKYLRVEKLLEGVSKTLSPTAIFSIVKSFPFGLLSIPSVAWLVLSEISRY